MNQNLRLKQSHFSNHRTELRRFNCVIHFQFGMTHTLIQFSSESMDVIDVCILSFLVNSSRIPYQCDWFD